MVEEIINIKGENYMFVNKKNINRLIKKEMEEHGMNFNTAKRIVMDHLKHFTYSVNGHNHTWRRKDKRTSIDSGHSHPIDLRNMIARMGRTNHVHKLSRISL